jgi:cobalt/nickel transport system ATP-binding protein
MIDSQIKATVVKVDDLHFSYPDGHIALRGISLNLCLGDKVALVGPNGAGKSTLMLHLNGILNGHGAIEVGGVQLTKDNLPVIRAMVGLVFQNPDDQLFSPTVLDDVAFGPLNLGLEVEEARARALEALSAVGLAPGAGERVPFQLSGGDKRRAALAGVLAMRPSVLLLDEPSAFLDPRGRRELIALIRSLPGTKLIATHDLDLVLDVCPRVLVLDGGRLVADGSAAELLAHPEIIENHGLEIPQRLRKE